MNNQDKLQKIHDEIQNVMLEYHNGTMLMTELFGIIDRLNYEADDVNFSNLIDPATGLRYPEDM